MGRLVTVAACSLRQWALDFEGNTERIIDSIRQAKAAGARLRVGPELEISGYSCNDHFLEPDLYLHCMEMLVRILSDEDCHGILLDIGLPVTHRNVNYNCRVVCLDGKILFIRPKMHLANDGNYREMRYFTPWLRQTEWEEFHLPKSLQKLQGATHVPFGDCVVSTPDSCFGAETCEEMWSPQAPHISMTLDGVEIITNSSASHFSLQKLDVRLKLIGEATRKCGGVYVYSNVQGGDGERLYFDGCAMIFCNGEVLAQSPQFSLNDVDVVTATVDLEEVRAYRSSMSRALQAARSTQKYHRIQTSFEMSPDEDDMDLYRRPTLTREARFHSVEEEVALCAGCYLWDYLARSKSAGYLAPLSGGLDSCATTVSVFSMCRLVISAIKDDNQTVIATVKRMFGDAPLPKTPQELCNRILPTTRKLAGGGGLLVLGSANVGEALRGYLTKYDCSSADINPIGSIDKADLKRFIAWAQVQFEMPCLEEFLTATPTAELEPVTEDYVQSDEADMGMSYAELTVFGRLRKERKMGPLSMWQHLVHVWGKDREKGPEDENPMLEPAEIAQKVKFFFVHYAITRHKATTLTPALHCNDYSPDDNRFDLRPFLYPSFWQSWSFKRIDKELARVEKARKKV
ncbi:hypothetical protein HYQ45_015107 [Verticillium longisporum]|uniref:Glutamine-dependent NAD(+) synthetase n=1 Tax=Verticillium longisporum TaxID=100787 RepID=A0A8I3AHS1_VERLO|nr:hypothetical protein HYQ45_015107 [Verticillium longisporum]